MVALIKIFPFLETNFGIRLLQAGSLRRINTMVFVQHSSSLVSETHGTFLAKDVG